MNKLMGLRRAIENALAEVDSLAEKEEHEVADAVSHGVTEALRFLGVGQNAPTAPAPAEPQAPEQTAGPAAPATSAPAAQPGPDKAQG